MSDARPTPYDVIFGPAVFEARIFPAIDQELSDNSELAAMPDAFLRLQRVAELLRELQPEDAPAAQMRGTALLLFHAYHFWRGGKRRHALDGGALDDALSARVTRVSLPSPSGYMQIPQHRVWAKVDEAAPAEPIDGFFWVAVDSAESVAPARLDLLFALGVRPGRAGVSVLDVQVPDPHSAEVTDVLHDTSLDFANILPGGELRGLRGVASRGEALRFAALCLAHDAAEARADG